MTITYIDASTAMKLIVGESESNALIAELSVTSDRRLTASWLLHAELHCAAGRHPGDVDLAMVRSFLDTVNLIDLTRGDMLAAGTHPPLRSNDAIHLAVALRVGSDEIFTYDSELALAAQSAGLAVRSPGVVSP